MKKFIYLFVLILLCISAFANADFWENCEMPSVYNEIVYPTMPPYSYWMEGENAIHNGSVFETKAYGEKEVLFTEKKDNQIKFTINVETSGKYVIMGACGPLGALHISPMDLYIDDVFIKEFTEGGNDFRWGWEKSACWVCFGVAYLEKGTHTFTFKIYKKRALDEYVTQTFDAISLLDYNVVNVNLKVNMPKTDRISAKPKDTVHVSLHPILKKSNIKISSTVGVPIKLMKRDHLIKEYTVNFYLDPKKTNESLNIDFDMEIPFDVSEGEYYLESPKIDSNRHLLDIDMEGVYPTCKKKTLVGKNLSLEKIYIFRENGEPKLSFHLTCDFLTPSSSDILTVLFEKKKDVVYYGASVKIPNLYGATGKFSSDKIYISFPFDLPQGEYKLLLSLNNDITQSVPITVQIPTNWTEKNTSLKPVSYGFYKDNTGMTQVWYATDTHTLMWNGEPFMAISGMLGGNYMWLMDNEEGFEKWKANIQKLKKHNINHVYLFGFGGVSQRAPYKFETMMDYLEQEGFTYVIGYSYGTNKYDPLKIREIHAGPEKIEIIKNVSGKFIGTEKNLDFVPAYMLKDLYSIRIVVMKTDRVVGIKEGKITSNDGSKVTFVADLGNEPVDIAIDSGFYALHPISNPWKNGQEQVADVQKDLLAAQLRPGFRGFVDMILPNERGMANEFEPIFIESPEFFKDRVKRLKNKYKSFSDLKKSWMVKGDFVKTFEDAATLYPIYNNGESVFLVSSFDTKIYEIDSNGPFWYEYLDMKDESYRDLQDAMMDGVKKVCDAPIALKMTGMTEIFNSPVEPNRKGIDGVGCETYSTGEGHIVYDVGFRYGEMETAKKQMFGSTTEMARGWSEDMYPNWQDIHSLFYDLSVTHYLGNKITYLFLLETIPHDQYTKNRILIDERILEWMSLWQEILRDKKEVFDKYKPMVYYSWPRCDPWWPICSERRAVKDVSDAYGVNCVKCENGVWAVPALNPFAKTDAVFVTLKDTPATDYYKKDFETLLTYTDREIILLGHRKNLGALSVDKYYTNEYFEDENYVYQVLKPCEGAEIIHQDNGKIYGMKVGNLQFVAMEPKKKIYSLESIVKFAKLPDTDIAKKNAHGFLENALGMKFATFGGNSFKAVETELGGKSCVILHTTSQKGGEIIEFEAQKECTFSCPYLKVEKDLKKGEKISVTLPVNDPLNKSLGAGLGYIKIIGENLQDISLFKDGNKMEFDGLPKVTPTGYEISALPKGCVLPKPKRDTSFSNTTIEMAKAISGFDLSLEAYEKEDYGTCQRLLEEYRPLAGESLSVSFNVFLGNVCLLRGDREKSVLYYETALRINPENKDAMVGLGCALFSTDKEKAGLLWKSAGTEEAVMNLAIM